MRYLLLLVLMATTGLEGQISTPPGCKQACGPITVMFCQVPDAGPGMNPAAVANCRACVAAAPECGTGAGIPAEITSPLPGPELTEEIINFTWNQGTRIANYIMEIDKVPGGARLGSFGPSKALSARVKMPPEETNIYVTLYSNTEGGQRLSKSYTFHYPGPAGVDLTGSVTTQSSGTSGPTPGTNVATAVENDPSWTIFFRDPRTSRPKCVQVGTVKVRWDFVSDYLGQDVYVERQGCTAYAPAAALRGAGAFGFQAPGTSGGWTSAGPFRADAGGYNIQLDGAPIQALRLRKRGRTQLKFSSISMQRSSNAPSPTAPRPTMPSPTTQKPPSPDVPTKGPNSLSGVWLVNGDPNRRARIEHLGAFVTFYNEHGQRSRGQFTDLGMVAQDWNAFAKIENDENKLAWSNGASWQRAGNTAPPLPPQTGMRYIGCFRDTPVFDLDGYLARSRSNTPEACVAQCRQGGFAYAGVQYGESCLCGNKYGKYGVSNACTMPCTGNPSQACGGINANSIFTTGNPVR